MPQQDKRLSRREKLLLARAAITGAVAGAVRAVVAWFLEHILGQ